MSFANPKLVPLKCYSCPTVEPKGRDIEWWQCSECIRTNQPRPARRHDAETDHADQLELGEVAS